MGKEAISSENGLGSFTEMIHDKADKIIAILDGVTIGEALNIIDVVKREMLSIKIKK